jgi:hypothetical protein
MIRSTLLITLGLLLSSGCRSGRAPEETTDAIFRHRVECEKYQKGFEDEAKALQDSFRHDIIYSVFYSAKRDSCLVAKYIVFTNSGLTKDPTDIYAETAEIDDVLDHRKVWAQDYSGGEEDSKMEQTLDGQIDALK